MYSPNRSASWVSVYGTLLSLSQNQSPFPEGGLSSDDIQHANVKWAEFFKNHPSDMFTIQLSSLAGCGT